MILFDILEELEIGETRFPETVLNWSTEDYNVSLELINRAVIESRNAIPKNATIYVANTKMSGGRFPCSSLDCRFGNLDFLARNSLLYADTVYIQNWFEDYHHIKQVTESDKLDFANSIGLLHQIRPLLEKGYFEICSSEHHFCADCMNQLYGKGLHAFDKKLDDASKYLLKQFEKKLSFTLLEEFGVPTLHVDGPSKLLDHPMAITFKNSPPERISKFYDPSTTIELSKKQIQESKIAEFFSNKIIDDLQYQDYYGKITGSSYLTTREIDLEVLEKINSEESNRLNNSIFSKLAHTIPFALNVSIDSLIELREKEGEAFEVYRDQINSITKNLNGVSENEVQDILHDGINQELNKINRTFKNSRSILKKGLAKDVVIGSCFVGVSLYTGILPTDVAAIVGALGGAEFASKIGNKVIGLKSDPYDVKEQNLYFLWKLQHDMNTLE